MAVTSVNEMAVPSPLTLGKESNTFTRKYKVLVTVGGLQGAIEAATGPGIPKVGDELTVSKSFNLMGNSGYCDKVTPVLQAPTSDYFHYIVTCTYLQNGAGGGGGGGSTDNSEAYTLSYSYDKSEVIVWNTVDNSPTGDGEPKGILNSVGDPFSQPLRISIPVLTINIQDTKSFYNPLDAMDYLHTINHAGITIAGVPYPEKSLMLTEFSADRAMQNGSIVWDRTIKLTAAASPFTDDYKIKILDQGFNYWADAGAGSGDSGVTSALAGLGLSVGVLQKKAIKIGTNKDKARTPQLLDGNGKLLGDGDKPKFLEFEIFETTNFGFIDLPSLEGTTSE